MITDTARCVGFAQSQRNRMSLFSRVFFTQYSGILEVRSRCTIQYPGVPRVTTGYYWVTRSPGIVLDLLSTKAGPKTIPLHTSAPQRATSRHGRGARVAAAADGGLVSLSKNSPREVMPVISCDVCVLKSDRTV